MPAGMKQAISGMAKKKKPPIGEQPMGETPPAGGMAPPQGAPPPKQPPGMSQPSSPDGSPGGEGGTSFKSKIKDQMGRQLASGASAGDQLDAIAGTALGTGARYALEKLMKKRKAGKQ